MTIDELIKELETIKYKRGGNIRVYFESMENGESIGISEVTYQSGGMTNPSGVLIS